MDVAVWFLISVFFGWVLMDLRYTPRVKRAAIERPRRGGVYYGGPTPAGDPPIPPQWRQPIAGRYDPVTGRTETIYKVVQPSAVLSTDEPLTPERRDAMQAAWFAHGGRPSTVVETWGGDVVRSDPDRSWIEFQK